MKNFSCLYKEPDLPSKIFALLNPEDLCLVPRICTDWRDLVVIEHAWKQKLHNQTRLISWRTFLSQLDWEHLDHQATKSLFITVSKILGPNSLTPAFLERITSDGLEKPLSLATTLEEKTWLRKGQDDHNTLLSNAPEIIKPLNQPNERMSKLVLFGPATFPILATDSGFILMAGAHYGKGRVVVVAHEEMLGDVSLMRGAADWCSGQPGCPIICDPTSKSWSDTTNSWEYINAVNYPPNVRLLPRHKVTNDIPVYLTQGHYEDYSELLLEYVKQGGGLVVGGHAWWWTYLKNNRLWPWELANSQRVCSLLEHPGNKIISHVGIAFSREPIDEVELNIRTDKVLGLRSSIYHAMRCRHEHPSVDFHENLVSGTDYAEFYGFINRLKKQQSFQEIIFYIEQNFTAASASTLSILQWRE